MLKEKNLQQVTMLIKKSFRKDPQEVKQQVDYKLMNASIINHFKAGFMQKLETAKQQNNAGMLARSCDGIDYKSMPENIQTHLTKYEKIIDQVITSHHMRKFNDDPESVTLQEINSNAIQQWMLALNDALYSYLFAVEDKENQPVSIPLKRYLIDALGQNTLDNAYELFGYHQVNYLIWNAFSGALIQSYVIVQEKELRNSVDSKKYEEYFTKYYNLGLRLINKLKPSLEALHFKNPNKLILNFRKNLQNAITSTEAKRKELLTQSRESTTTAEYRKTKRHKYDELGRLLEDLNTILSATEEDFKGIGSWKSLGFDPSHLQHRYQAFQLSCEHAFQQTIADTKKHTNIASSFMAVKCDTEKALTRSKRNICNEKIFTEYKQMR